MNGRMLRELELAEVVSLCRFEASTATEHIAVVEAPVAAPVARSSPAIRPDVSNLSWSELREVVRLCAACGLCDGRKQAVFGVGAESGPWLFIGEGPGADEDEQGDPFVGQAGKLLDSMLAAAGLQRGRDTYIANVVKCRPPNNRTPTLEEAQACGPFLDRQIELVDPKIIVALGKSAASLLLGNPDASVASMRGKVHDYRGRPLIVTYHPAYLLRTLPDKAKAWDDLLLARRTLQAAA